MAIGESGQVVDNLNIHTSAEIAVEAVVNTLPCHGPVSEGK